MILLPGAFPSGKTQNRSLKGNHFPVVLFSFLRCFIYYIIFGTFFFDIWHQALFTRVVKGWRYILICWYDYYFFKCAFRLLPFTGSLGVWYYMILPSVGSFVSLSWTRVWSCIKPVCYVAVIQIQTYITSWTLHIVLGYSPRLEPTSRLSICWGYLSFLYVDQAIS